MKRRIAAVAGLLGLLVLLVFGPTRIHGWAGRAWENVVAVASPQSGVDDAQDWSMPARSWEGVGNHLGLPPIAEVTDQAVLAACFDCEQWLWPLGFELSEVDNGLVDRVDETTHPGTGGPAALMGQLGAGSAGGTGGWNRGGGLRAGGGGTGRTVGSASGGQAAATSPGSGSDEARHSASNETSTSDQQAFGNAPASGGKSPLPQGPDDEVLSTLSGGQSPSSQAASQEPDNLLLSPIAGGNSPPGDTTSPADEELPGAVVQALLTSPVGSETIYGEGDAGKVNAKTNIGAPSNSSGGAIAQDVDIVPEPAVLILMGVGLAVGASRLRQRPLG